MVGSNVVQPTRYLEFPQWLNISLVTSMTTSFSVIQKTFLSSPFFAVVGASKDQNKFGTKVGSFQSSFLELRISQVLKWYKDRTLNVTPIHLVRE
jgi:hypothetical protein